jgi:hypothetical protein
MIKLPKPSQYPKKVFLRGESYRIVFVKNLEHIGETDPAKKVIRIRAGMSDNETFRTLVHELLHFLEFEWPVKIRHKQVYKLEKAIFQLIIDNFV